MINNIFLLEGAMVKLYGLCINEIISPLLLRQTKHNLSCPSFHSSITTVCMCSFYILNENYSKLCMIKLLSCNDIVTAEKTFLRVIAPFHFDYFFQMFVRATPTFSMKISPKLFMIKLQQFDQNFESYCLPLFTFNIFQKVVWTTPTFSMGIASKLCILAYNHTRICILVQQF